MFSLNQINIIDLIFLILIIEKVITSYKSEKTYTNSKLISKINIFSFENIKMIIIYISNTLLYLSNNTTGFIYKLIIIMTMIIISIIRSYEETPEDKQLI